MDLERVRRDARGGFRGNHLGHAGLDVVAGAGVLQACRVDHHRVCNLDVGSHLCQLERDRLVLEDRLTEGLALLGVLDRELERADRDTAAAGGYVDPAYLDAVHHLVETLADALFASEHSRRRDLVVVEHHLGGLDALVAHLVDLAGDGEATRGLEPRLLLQQEGAHVLVHRVAAGVSLDQRGHHRGVSAVRQPHLLAVDRPLIPVADGLGGDRRNVGATARLGHRERAAHIAGRHPRKVVLLLLVGTVLDDQVRDDEVSVDDARDAHPPAREFLDAQHVGQQRLAETAVLLRDHEPEQAHLLHPLENLLGVRVVVLERLRVRDDLLVDELADRAEDLLLNVRQARGLGQPCHALPPPFHTLRTGFGPPESTARIAVRRLRGGRGQVTDAFHPCALRCVYANGVIP